ncbi:MAG: hypothetical protein DI565_19620 [Ancylobacter novellus]|uniref:Uncharacterized protein n=1 Tax=Ancylobacter novellus TaxID=921 RepID=A0A2W5K646_ANCNO|nr:MAG: hypothetical protein DI565_19620 [Ancylobacter novellus]
MRAAGAPGSVAVDVFRLDRDLFLSLKEWGLQRGYGCDLTIGQQGDRTPTLEAEDDRSIAADASDG